MTALQEILKEIDGALESSCRCDGAECRPCEARQSINLEALQALLAAGEDAFSALTYIRLRYGDLYGVGWDRVFNARAEALHELGDPVWIRVEGGGE
jgi:hypothetical protein